MSFQQPALLLLLLILPLLAGLKLWGDLRSRRAAGRVASPRLLPGLLQPRGRGRDWAVLGLELGALACFIVALARPQYGVLEEETGSGGRSLIIAIDTSRSMLTEDLKPSRLIRTQLAAADLVKRLRGDRIGLMPFAGSAFLYAPITPDTDALLESIDSLDTEIIPRGGSNLARPIDLALETFAKSEMSGQQVLVIFSDGENLEGTTLAAAERAREKKMTIIAFGVGTQAGALIPDPEGADGYYRDPEGKPVMSRLQRDVLLSLANTTGGLYLPLDENGVNDRRIDLVLQKLERTTMKGKVTKKAVDQYRWPLGAGLLLLLAAWLAGIVKRHRAGAPSTGAATAVAGAGLVLLLMPVPGAQAAVSPAEAPAESVPGNPWEAYRAGNYSGALSAFSRRLAADGKLSAVTSGDPALEFGRGAAAFKTRDYGAAIDAFGGAVLTDDIALRASAHYNLANAVYQRAAEQAAAAKPKTLAKLSFLDGLIRQLENSLENYQQALILKPDDEEFQANHDTTDALIQKLREIRRKMAEQQGKGEGKQKGKKKGKKGEGQSSGKGKGEGDETGEGPDGDEEGEGAGRGEEGDEEKAAREKSNEHKEGDIGEQGKKGERPDDEGEPGKGREGEDGEESEEGEEADNEINPETGFSPAEAKRQLERLSDEDMRVRPRIESAREARPLKDW